MAFELGLLAPGTIARIRTKATLAALVGASYEVTYVVEHYDGEYQTRISSGKNKLLVIVCSQYALLSQKTSGLVLGQAVVGTFANDYRQYRNAVHDQASQNGVSFGFWRRIMGWSPSSTPWPKWHYE